ncbi:MAG: hypothetical protein ACO1PB_21920, partial [Ramlibacter sp.]
MTCEERWPEQLRSLRSPFLLLASMAAFALLALLRRLRLLPLFRRLGGTLPTPSTRSTRPVARQGHFRPILQA